MTTNNDKSYSYEILCKNKLGNGLFHKYIEYVQSKKSKNKKNMENIAI